MADFDHDNNTTDSNYQPLSARDDSAKTNALFAYIMMGLGYFTGICWFIGGIWAIVKISDYRGTQFEDHYANIISVFWWGLGLTIIGMVTTFIFIGWLILLGTFVWSIFRLVKGLANLTSNKPYNRF